MGILNEILYKKRKRVSDARSKTSTAELRSIIGDVPEARPFSGVLQREQDEMIRVIAEIKKASPSQGLIRTDFDPVSIARIYEEMGASAVSVLTEEDFFQGNLDYIPLVKETIALPVLRKDFIIDEYQIYEARAFQADAILLIAAVLSKGQAAEFLEAAEETGLSVLFEVHNWKELERALEINAPIIGINNRNLDTLAIDLNTTIDLIKDIPAGKVVVTESGISKRSDVKRYENAGVNAVLIGTALMKDVDIRSKYNELFR